VVTPTASDRSGLPGADLGFPPVVKEGARILVLGSMPGRVSLEKHQYYGHPQNSFWPLMESLFDISSQLEYEERLRLITRQGIALWDVLKSCIRPGSLDSSIDARSIVTNDFQGLFETAPGIRAIFFNGSTAEREYRKRVVPTLIDEKARIPCNRLPSTSPAMASLTKLQKLQRWSLVRETLEVLPQAP